MGAVLLLLLSLCNIHRDTLDIISHLSTNKHLTCPACHCLQPHTTESKYCCIPARKYWSAANPQSPIIKNGAHTASEATGNNQTGSTTYSEQLEEALCWHTQPAASWQSIKNKDSKKIPKTKHYNRTSTDDLVQWRPSEGSKQLGHVAAALLVLQNTLIHDALPY